MARTLRIPVALTLALIASAAPAPAQAPPETAERLDGSRVAGRLVASQTENAEFVPDAPGPPIPWSEIARITSDGRGPSSTSGPAPFQVRLGSGRKVSGQLLGLDRTTVKLAPATGPKPLTIARGGVSALVQRPGEVEALRDGFEALDPTRWSQTGRPVASAAKAQEGERALRLPASGSSVTARVAEPIASGRFELAFWDDGKRVAGQRWYVDLTCRKGVSDLGTVRVVLGWSDEAMSVETPGGPALTVQPLARKPGWHRLALRFDAERTSVSVDGDDLAHGRGLGGPVVEVRIAAEATGATRAPAGLAAIVDDLRLVRFAEPSGLYEVDPTQDEIRMASGDQLFGQVESADASGLLGTLEGKPLSAPWSEVSGVHFRRAPATSELMGGAWASVQWRTAPGDDPRDLDEVEGAIAALSVTELSLDVPFVGRVVIPRSSLTRVVPRGRGMRLVIDASTHHIGDRFVPDMDPPQAQEAPVAISFRLTKPPEGGATLLIDAEKVIAEEGVPEYSELVKKGELRTGLTLDGRRLDDLNGHVTPNLDAPQRLRIPIPAGLLKAGENTLTIEQAGTKADPRLRDNLGISRIAIEFAKAGGP